ncbi:hypothetical protein JMJ35_003238 [Cladonia borealis]|uniref:H/ACA ribonucleoprotein complex non-core subunit NAF1 n=1 Tax=Cladonia borealis TaxID=184061 RepID=A0AA39R5V2_9LECA|nr:hypothetical protein JMJ35_003238 [Cladonia borealis]
MDGAEDFEMPSPKRPRVEAQEPDTYQHPDTPKDDMGDIYGTTQDLTASPRGLASTVPMLENSQAIPTFPPLPGLGMVHDEPQLPTEDGKPDLQVSEGLIPLQTTTAPEQKSDNNSSRQEQASQDGGESQIGIEDKITLDKNKDIHKNTSYAESASQGIGENAGQVLRTDTSVKDGVPAQSDEVMLNSKLGQANIGSQSLGEGVKSHTPLVTGAAKSDFSAADGVQKGLSQDSTQGAYSAGDNGSSAVEVKHAVDPTEMVAHTELTFEGLAEANKANAEAEFELDSSPLESSSSDSSSDSSSSDDSEADSDAEEYEMLSPEEEARRLMAEDGGSDDGHGKGSNENSHVVRTTNEKPDEIVPKPDITVTADMKIEELGFVENIVENIAVIKAKVSGEYEVLETGSLLCLEDRSVIGVVAETLGRVQQPYYCVRFTNASAMDEAGIRQNTKIFWVGEHSTTVFTQPLKAFKGTDASNLHDEEVGDDELEFSDDEAEAEHRRRVKLQKRSRHNVRDGPADGFSRGPQQRHRGSQNRFDRGPYSRSEHMPSSRDISLHYDDNDAMNTENGNDDELYTPLTRPSNLHEMMEREPRSAEGHSSRGNSNRGGRGGGRGDRQRHGGNRGTDKSGKFDRRDHGGLQGDARSRGRQHSPPFPQSNASGLPPRNQLPPRPPQHKNDHGPYPSQGNVYQPQGPSMPPPNQITYAQSNSYPNFAPQYANSYAQSYSQPQRSQMYPSQYPPPQANPQYQQPHASSPQGYQSYHSFPSQSQYSAQPAAYTPYSPTNIPPGAHINPAFLQQQAQMQSQPWQQPVSDATRRVQENLNLMKGFGGGGTVPK